jgi:hypothetical protein
MEAINITAYTNDEAQIEAVKAVLKAFKIRFEVTKEKPYNPEFVAKIKKSQQDYKEGKGRTVTIEELNALWK